MRITFRSRSFRNHLSNGISDGLLGRIRRLPEMEFLREAYGTDDNIVILIQVDLCSGVAGATKILPETARLVGNRWFWTLIENQKDEITNVVMEVLGDE